MLAALFPFLAFQAVTTVWIAAQLAIARVLAVRPKLISLGVGPKIVRTRLAGVDTQLALLPTGGFVQLERMEAFAPGKAAAVALTPWFTVAAIAVALGARTDDFLAGATALGRLRDVFAHWADWYPQFVATPVITAAQLTARLVAINLLPLPALAGWTIVRLIVPPRIHERAALPMTVLALLVMVLCAVFRSPSS